MANLITPAILATIAQEMGNLEDSFAKHTFQLLQSDTITDKFDDIAGYANPITIKCLLVPRTRVDESDSVVFDDLGTTPHQQLTLYVFRREAIAKGIYDTSNKLLIREEDQILFNDEQYYINQKSPVGFFEEAGELIKIRVTKKIEEI